MGITQAGILCLVDSQVSSELRDLLRAEESKMINSFTAAQRRVAVLELVRSIDHFFLSRNSRNEQSTHREEEIDSFFIYGCNKALQLFLDESTQQDMVPLTRSTEETRKWIRNARENGKRLGRPRRSVNQEELRRLRSEGASLRQIAKELGVGYGTVRLRLRNV